VNDRDDPQGREDAPQDGLQRERVDISQSVRSLASRLAAPGVLTERQALAYVLRDVEGVPREETADRLKCSESNLDTLLGRARSNVDDAAATLSVLHRLDSTPSLARLDD